MFISNGIWDLYVWLSSGWSPAPLTFCFLLSVSLFSFSCFLIFSWRASSIFFSRLSLSITSSGNSLSWPSASSSMKSPSSNWTSWCPVGTLLPWYYPLWRGLLVLMEAPHGGWQVNRLSGGDRQGSSVFPVVVPFWMGPLEKAVGLSLRQGSWEDYQNLALISL